MHGLSHTCTNCCRAAGLLYSSYVHTCKSHSLCLVPASPMEAPAGPGSPTISRARRSTRRSTADIAPLRCSSCTSPPCHGLTSRATARRRETGAADTRLTFAAEKLPLESVADTRLTFAVAREEVATRVSCRHSLDVCSRWRKKSASTCS